MTTFRARLHAEDGLRFGPLLFQGHLDKPLPLRLPDGSTGTAVLRAFDVAPDGASVELTLDGELPDGIGTYTGTVGLA